VIHMKKKRKIARTEGRRVNKQRAKTTGGWKTKPSRQRGSGGRQGDTRIQQAEKGEKGAGRGGVAKRHTQSQKKKKNLTLGGGDAGKGKKEVREKRFEMGTHITFWNRKSTRVIRKKSQMDNINKRGQTKFNR